MCGIERDVEYDENDKTSSSYLCFLVFGIETVFKTYFEWEIDFWEV